MGRILSKMPNQIFTLCLIILIMITQVESENSKYVNNKNINNNDSQAASFEPVMIENKINRSNFFDVTMSTDSTAKYFWDVNGNGSCELTIAGADADDGLSQAIAVGDIDGDGINDLLVSSSKADGPLGARTDCGELYIYYGNGLTQDSLLSNDADVVIYGRDLSDLFGTTLALGDVNGDDTLDIIVGAMWGDGQSNNQFATGEVYVFFGTNSLAPSIDLQVTLADIEIYGPPNNVGGMSNQLGTSLECGDINGDNIDDIIMMAPGYEKSGHDDNSGTWVYLGRTSWPSVIQTDDLGDPTQPDVFIYPSIFDAARYQAGGPPSGTYFIYNKALAIGDINCDSVDDLIILYVNGSAGGQAGEAHVFFGNSVLPATLSSGEEDINITSQDAADRPLVVRSVDYNSDGCDDVVISSRYGQGPGNSRLFGGEFWVIFGQATWPKNATRVVQTESDALIYGAEANDRAHDLCVTDLNNDNINEILVGTYLADGPNNFRNISGEISLFYRPDTLPAIVDLATVQRDAAIYGLEDDVLGLFGIASGDILGDNRVDIIIGATFSNNSINRVGRLYAIEASTFNTGDADNDAIDDVCDPCPNDPGNDTDQDGVCAAVDNCVDIANPGQADADNDNVGDACDNCPDTPNTDQADSDGNGIGDACDGCCVGLTGNVDNDPGDNVDISDITALIDFLFISGSVPVCTEEANCDGDPGNNVDISDLTALIDFLFISGTPLVPCL